MSPPLLLCLALTQPALPDTLRVRVTSGERPLPAARVSAASAPVARTGPDGRAILLLAPGSWTVRVAREGYAPDSAVITVPFPGETRFDLAPLEELEELAVSATRTNRRLADEPSRVEVLSREEIEEKLLMTPGDIQMLLNESSGLRVQSASPSLGGANLRIQGLRGRYTQILVDGLPLAGAQAGSLGLLQIPPMDLGRVEVVKGIASSFHGGSALGGLVNLVSRQPEGREVLLNQTTLDGTDLVGWAGGRLGDRIRGSVLAGLHRQARADRDGDGWTDVAGYRRAVIRPRGYWEDDSGRAIQATAGLTLEDREGGTLPGRVAPDGLPFREGLNSWRLDTGASARFPAGSTVLTTRAAATAQRHDRQIGTVDERYRRFGLFAEAAWTAPLGRGALVLGLSLELDQLRFDERPVLDYHVVVPAGFGQYDVDLTGRLALTVTARIDRHSRYGTFASPRMALRQRIGDHWTVRWAAGAGFFGPTPFTEEIEAIGLTRLAPPADLEAERAVGTSLDVGRASGPVELNLSAFGSILRRSVLLVAGAEPGTVALANSPGATRTGGLELLARYRQTPFQLTATWTAIVASEQPPTGPERRTVPYNPSHAVGLVGTWEAEGRSRAGLELFLTGPQDTEDDPYRDRTPAYVIAGVIGEHRVGRARLFLNLENLTDRRLTRYGPFVRPARGVDGRWTVNLWAPAEGRVANAGIRLDW